MQSRAAPGSPAVFVLQFFALVPEKLEFVPVDRIMGGIAVDQLGIQQLRHIKACVVSVADEYIVIVLNVHGYAFPSLFPSFLLTGISQLYDSTNLEKSKFIRYDINWIFRLLSPIETAPFCACQYSRLFSTRKRKNACSSSGSDREGSFNL